MSASQSTTTPPTPDAPEPKIDLSLTQVLAAALAAMTAAAIGSRLGIAGTLAGAAGASVMLTVGTALYRASLEHSQERIRAMAVHRTRIPSPRTPDQSPGRSAQDTTGSRDARDETGTAASDSSADGVRPAKFRWLVKMTGRRWATVIVGALGGFALAMMVVTGFEWARGETLSGYSDGTTIGHVIGPPTGPADPAPVPDQEESPAEDTPDSTVDPDAPTPSPTEDPDLIPELGTEPEPSPPDTTESPRPTGESPSPPLVRTVVPEGG